MPKRTHDSRARARSWLKQRAWARKLNAWLEWVVVPSRLWHAEREDARRPQRPEGYPLPPPRLRYRVHGLADQDSFLRVGSQCANDVLAALASEHIRLEPGADVLDFGCGCGRVLRHLLVRRPDWHYTGVDIDDTAIAWCRSAYPGVTFLTTPAKPSTQFDDASFDLAIAISVFTHLDHEYQDKWLDELFRLVRPGGYIFLSVRNQAESTFLPAADREQLRQEGILFRSWRTGRLKLDGLPDFYQTTYHTRAYVERSWARRLTLIAYLPRAINHDHDAVILQRPPSPAGVPAMVEVH